MFNRNYYTSCRVDVTSRKTDNPEDYSRTLFENVIYPLIIASIDLGAMMIENDKQTNEDSQYTKTGTQTYLIKGEEVYKKD